ncbi:MAG: hypothetical protein ACOX3E_05460 [Desulfomonilia bacterium]|nr:hypothetical protein [Pseudomonadota bacterium]HON37584.1 hypothetical protein [Deltaproteobacteria bacterium]HPD21442.1 hypothetical protein [Deltaproteobacteria bacterium]HPX19486.1 hypothetical protein [Deltaproteobacteria bacterium]
MKSRCAIGAACVLVIALILCTGCGRKLPPLPPGMPDPVELVSAGFEENEVVVKARCNVPGSTITLLGKPKGLCPSCTDDLMRKDEAFVEEAGTVHLRDTAPDASYMVYRIAFSKGTLVWMTDARVVRRR